MFFASYTEAENRALVRDAGFVIERDEGLSWAHIASRLMANGTPSPSGAERWSPSAVRRQCERATKEPE